MRLAALLQSTDCIRYSTTQGTNALVQRAGPQLGLLVTDPTLVEGLAATQALSASQLDDARAQRDVSSDDVARANAQLRQALTNGSYSPEQRGSSPSQPSARRPSQRYSFSHIRALSWR